MARNLKIVGVIPARLDSRRLPRKVLRPIGGRPMLHWVYQRAAASPLLAQLVVASDSDEILGYCLENNIPTVRTGQHPSGSDRLHEVMEKTDGDVYVNIQGDEPTVRADHIECLVKPIVEGRGEITTLKVAVDDASARDPNCVKVVSDLHGRALYFSRFPIPYNREGLQDITHYKHIGLYGYTRAALALFHSLPPSSLEKVEKLEQLRFLENGIPILVEETPFDTIGVDTEEDLERAAALLSAEESRR
jgi:3-deoxy-manno-octulosonate cytidylyltransferase (CMP-KDO synthetase)